MQDLRTFASHVPFLRKILEVTLLESECVNRERGKGAELRGQDPTGHPGQRCREDSD